MTLQEVLNEMIETVRETNATLERIKERNQKTYDLLNKSLKEVNNYVVE